jgi:hypothetical protein
MIVVELDLGGGGGGDYGYHDRKVILVLFGQVIAG